MAKQKPYTTAQKEKILETAKALREQGLSQQATAKKLGIHVNTYLKWMAAAGPQDTAEAKSVKPTAKKTVKEKVANAAPKKTVKPAAKKEVVAKPNRKRSRTGRVRYTPEQKKQMTQTALEMLKRGKAKRAILRKIGVSYKTLLKLLKDKQTPETKTIIKSASSPLDRMAAIHARVLEINDEVAKLGQEKASLQKEMKVVYDRLGEEIMR